LKAGFSRVHRELVANRAVILLHYKTREGAKCFNKNATLLSLDVCRLIKQTLSKNWAALS
jgi:hypothetical protein